MSSKDYEGGYELIGCDGDQTKVAQYKQEAVTIH